MELNGKQRRHLRGLGHHLKPVTVVGRPGITGGVIEQTDAGLEDHELIKVKFGQGYEGGLADAAVTLAERTGSAVAGRVGRTALLYRRRDDDPRIVLP